MRRALFVISTQGLGHITRCRALALELGRRGWGSTMTTHAPTSVASVDLSVVDMQSDDGMVPEGGVLRAVSAKPVVRIANTCDVSEDIARYYEQVVALAVPNITVVGSPGALWEQNSHYATLALLGGRYAMLRPEFEQARNADANLPSLGHPGGVFDCRNISDWMAMQMACRMRLADVVVTWGGMRALEAACVRKGGRDLLIYHRNQGEWLNKQGLADGKDHIDGRGCQRVADALEELVK